MGTKFKTPKQKFEYRMKKNSVERKIFVELKPRKTWDNGITVEDLKTVVEKGRKKPLSKGRIYEAISLLNRYGKDYGIYIRSGYGHHPLTGKREYRYFVPTEQFDIDSEKRDLEHKGEILHEKSSNLEHQEKVTIPQELELAKIR